MYRLYLIVPGSQSVPPLPDTVVAAQHSLTTSDQSVLDLILHWLEICTSSEEHRSCRVAKPSRDHPARLIDVSPDDTARDEWKLVEVKDEPSIRPYVTLSHRWGSGNFKLDKTTYRDMLNGMQVSILPATYQDAIKVTRHLNIRYLWIDSICIFQDERLDIQKEAVSSFYVVMAATTSFCMWRV